MPTHLVCPICGKQFECNDPHDAPHDHELAPVAKCPVTKGAIYVLVKDNLNKGVPKVKTYCNGDATTDGLGFAFFEQLDEGSYETRIALDESDEAVKSGYYVTTRTTTTPRVEPGKITMVEFVLNGYATLRATLERTDGKEPLPRARVEVASSGHTPDEPSKTPENGKAEFGKLRPTELYTVRCTLHDDDRKSFGLEQAEHAGQKVTSANPTDVLFRIVPRYWVDLVLEDPKDEALKGSISLRQSDKRSAADDVGRDVKHVADLEPGTVDIEDVVLPESREFVSIT